MPQQLLLGEDALGLDSLIEFPSVPLQYLICSMGSWPVADDGLLAADGSGAGVVAGLLLLNSAIDPCSATLAAPFLVLPFLVFAPALSAGESSLAAVTNDFSVVAGVGGGALASDDCKVSSSIGADLFLVSAFPSGAGVSPDSEGRALVLLLGSLAFLAVFSLVDVSCATSRPAIEALDDSVEACCTALSFA